MTVTVLITPAQANVLDMYVNGSEALDEAIAAGVWWTKHRLTIPDDEIARDRIGFFVGMRAEIVEDWLNSSDAVDRGEARATINLRSRVAAAGITTD